MSSWKDTSTVTVILHKAHLSSLEKFRNYTGTVDNHIFIFCRHSLIQNKKIDMTFIVQGSKTDLEIIFLPLCRNFQTSALRKRVKIAQ